MIRRTIKRSTYHCCSASALFRCPVPAISISFPASLAFSTTAAWRLKNSTKIKSDSNNNAGHRRLQKKDQQKYALRIGYRSPALNDLAFAKRFFQESQTYHAASSSLHDAAFDTTIPQVRLLTIHSVWDG
ncbi:hypothetical protein LIPSTDRAFT_105518 [Lipomyces starkeyi NRRL Y-11557]|uniref:Uncharacterized protein n=1 Tax=Lipomyces starkeyi NRRL Y-11557 TaxID=675824 RepID=A0A1E3Q444_LIPST|nr:hypothetical protein LIPSTDRAFT_105518 [Lipomyces starkeyi NRRL Y-11557]